jgi:hypothetical protein
MQTLHPIRHSASTNPGYFWNVDTQRGSSGKIIIMSSTVFTRKFVINSKPILHLRHHSRTF